MLARLRWPLLAMAASMVVGAVVPGCFGRECEGSVREYGLLPGEGQMVDPDTWESNPIDGTWLFLPHQGQIFAYFNRTNLVPRTPDWVHVYISPSERPTAPDSFASFTLAGGNVAKLTYRNGVLQVYNDSCSDYFARIVVHAPPSTRNDGGGGDGGDSNAGDGSENQDAGGDAEGGNE